MAARARGARRGGILLNLGEDAGEAGVLAERREVGVGSQDLNADELEFGGLFKGGNSVFDISFETEATSDHHLREGYFMV